MPLTHAQFVRASWPSAEVFAVCSSATHGQDAGDVRRHNSRGSVCVSSLVSAWCVRGYSRQPPDSTCRIGGGRCRHGRKDTTVQNTPRHTNLSRATRRSSTARHLSTPKIGLVCKELKKLNRASLMLICINISSIKMTYH